MRLDGEAARWVAEDLAPGIAFGPYADRLEPVVDALVEERPVSRIEKLARTAAAAVWQEGLQAAAETELDRLEADTRETLVRLETARAELSRPVTDNRLANALVEELALSQLDAVVAMGMRLEELEDELREASPDERREIALRAIAELEPLEASAEDGRAAAAAMLEATASGTDADELLMQATKALSRSLATDERRREARVALGELASLTRHETPLLADAVDELLGERVPDDPADDAIWVAAVLHSATGPFDDGP